MHDINIQIQTHTSPVSNRPASESKWPNGCVQSTLDSEAVTSQRDMSCDKEGTRLNGNTTLNRERGTATAYQVIHPLLLQVIEVRP